MAFLTYGIKNIDEEVHNIDWSKHPDQVSDFPVLISSSQKVLPINIPSYFSRSFLLTRWVLPASSSDTMNR